MADTSYYRRGQVWFVEDKSEPESSIQSKSRPYLVVSNDMCNAHSSVIHMCPLTTKSKSEYIPTHVYITDPRGTSSTILVEQTRIISTKTLRNSRYQYTLTQEVMDRVDKALAIQFGINLTYPTIGEFERLLDSIIARKKEQMSREEQTLDNDKVAVIIDKISSAFNVENESSDNNPTTDGVVEVTVPKIYPPLNPDDYDVNKKPPRPSQIDKFNRRMHKTMDIQNSSTESPKTAPTVIDGIPVHYTPKGRIRWSPELKAQFCKDISSMSVKEVCDKYNITVGNYYNLVSRCRSESDSESQTITKTDDIPTTPEITDIPTMLKDYHAMPLTQFMDKYHFKDRESAIYYVHRYNSR